MRYLTLLCLTCLLTACAMTPQGYWRSPDRAEVNRHQDDIECTALASQAAQGAGGWTSVAPMRDAIYQQDRQDYFNTCIQGRGYSWVPAR